MANDEELAPNHQMIDNQRAKAQMKILEKLTNDTLTPAGYRTLAEAYAWLEAPSNSHGANG